MNKVSSAVTGAVTISAAALVPYVQWALNGGHGPLPDGSALMISSAIVTAAHYAYNYLQSKAEAKAAPKVTA